MFGKCQIDKCPFFHDLKEKALITKEDFCKSFKSSGKCPLETECKFSFFHKNCSYFEKGNCFKGDNCPFYHGEKQEKEKEDSEKKQEICQHFLKGMCKYGKSCNKLHICRYFLNGFCKMGTNCDLAHVKPEIKDGQSFSKVMPNQIFSEIQNGKSDLEIVPKQINEPSPQKKTEICQQFLDGDCKYGKKCYKVHACRHFYKGFCKMDKNCGFPHVKPEGKETKSESDSISTGGASEVIGKDESICCICMNNPSTHAIVPCGHMIYCENCLLKLRFCAKCRAPIQSIMKIYK
jgi:hypothetical protein